MRRNHIVTATGRAAMTISPASIFDIHGSQPVTDSVTGALCQLDWSYIVEVSKACPWHDRCQQTRIAVHGEFTDEDWSFVQSLALELVERQDRTA